VAKDSEVLQCSDELSISVMKCSWVQCGEVLQCSDKLSISVVKCSWVKCGEV